MNYEDLRISSLRQDKFEKEYSISLSRPDSVELINYVKNKWFNDYDLKDLDFDVPYPTPSIRVMVRNTKPKELEVN